MIKLIVIDLDDTLLDKKKNISFKNIQAIQEAIANHIQIVIASGRPYFRVKPILEKLGMLNNKNYVITFNGGITSNGTNSEILDERKLDIHDLQEILKTARKYGLCFNVYQERHIYTSKIEQSILKLPVYQGVDFIYQTDEEMNQITYAHKVIFADLEMKINESKPNVIADLGKKFTIVQSTPNFLEILPLNTSKGEALKHLAKSLGINKKEIMAIGDAENDLSMFDVAETKVAMANAISELKEKATFITKSCEENGVAWAIFHMIQGENRNE